MRAKLVIVGDIVEAAVTLGVTFAVNQADASDYGAVQAELS